MFQKLHCSKLQFSKLDFKVECSNKGVEFSHRFSEQIARFLQKKEQMNDSLKKTSDSLIFSERPERFPHVRSFLVSDLSESLMVAHFWWATWAIRSHRSLLVSGLINFLLSLTRNEGMRELQIFLNKKTYIKHTKK